MINSKEILLTGGSGTLGTGILEVFQTTGGLDAEMIAPTSKELDITSLKSVQEFLARRTRPITNIIHAAAMTDWEKADCDPKKAFETNAIGTLNMAIVAKQYESKLIYISTDAVFSGEKKKGGYTENDLPNNPVSIYGITKLAGEFLAYSTLPNLIIARLGWLFGPNPSKDKKFVGKILSQLANGTQEISAVSDKTGSPTYTLDAATRILELLHNDFVGAVHIVNSGIASRYEVAQEANVVWQAKANIKPVSSDKFPSPVKRPEFSGLGTLYHPLRSWQQALHDYQLKYPLEAFKKL